MKYKIYIFDYYNFCYTNSGDKMKTIKKPIVRVPLEQYTGTLEHQDTSNNIEYYLIEDQELMGKENYRIIFDTCQFNRVTFSNNEFLKSEFIDCIFDNCDLSNNSFIQSTFMRCEFINCKLTGSHIVESYLHHVVIKNCIGKYLDFAECKMNILEFKDCMFEESSFFNNNLKYVSFNTVNLEKASFFESSLKDIDLSTCELSGLKIDLKSIEGSTISPYQAKEVCHLLGIKVK